VRLLLDACFSLLLLLRALRAVWRRKQLSLHTIGVDGSADDGAFESQLTHRDVGASCGWVFGVEVLLSAAAAVTCTTGNLETKGRSCSRGAQLSVAFLGRVVLPLLLR
jgi:hypothetical protein